MGDSTISAKDVETFKRALGDFLRQVESWGHFENWLRSQPGVVLVNMADYLIKTEPPRKEVSVTFQMDDGSTVTTIIDVILYPDQTFGLAAVYEP